MKDATILVFGASGSVGGELVRLLRERKLPVRATTGKQAHEKDGVEYRHVNLVTGEGVSEAFAGVDKAFILSPAGYADQHAVLSPLIREARRRKLSKVVQLSAFGVEANETTPMGRAELELSRSGLAYNALRPNWFMQNFQTFWAHGIRERGKISLPAGDAKVSFIDTRDIAAVAAKLLTTTEFDNRAFTLTGPEAIDHARAAELISEATGRKVSYEDIRPEEFRSGLLAAGVPADYTEFLVTIMGYLKAGYSAVVTEEVNRILGRAPASFAAYAREHRKAWL
ncbi:MAG: SDR family oxidoreductase [Oligoflexia bacterium]|nr:SDR family oxidoreductase [Oligoflexia bacterium]